MWVSLKNNRMSATLDGRVASWGEAIPSKKTKNNSTKSIAIVHHVLPPRQKKHLSNKKNFLLSVKSWFRDHYIGFIIPG